MNYHPLNQSTYINGQPIGSIELKLFDAYRTAMQYYLEKKA